MFHDSSIKIKYTCDQLQRWNVMDMKANVACMYLIYDGRVQIHLLSYFYVIMFNHKEFRRRKRMSTSGYLRIRVTIATQFIIFSW